VSPMIRHHRPNSRSGPDSGKQGILLRQRPATETPVGIGWRFFTGLRLGPWKWRELGIECVLQWFWQEDMTAATECQLRATAFNAVAQA